MIWDYGVMHILLMLLSVYNFGLMYGFVVLVILYQVLWFVLPRFGYQLMIGNDIIHLYGTEKNPHNCVMYFEIDKIKFEEIRDNGMKETAIKKIRKYSQIPFNFFGFWLWKDVDKQEALKNFQKCDEEIHTKEDILKYLNRLINVKIPLTEPQWRARFIENYSKDRSV